MQYLSTGALLQGGKYKIIRHIASGGFGYTYEALDASMGNAHVAIKEFFVKDCCARNSVTQNVILAVESKRELVAKLKAKFLVEAEAIRRMKHDNIVRVYSSFEENDTAYYVMEYIDGLSLEQYGKLDEATALRYIRQIADALRYVHSQKCLHLDIKPANILIGKDDKAILINFGSSKYYDNGKAVTTTTMPGLYTPGYAPYEQTIGGITGFTPASDIYALGATLYRLLSGNTPPPSGQLLEGDVELPPLPYSVSESTRKAVEKAMIPHKRTRTQTVDDFLRCLDGGIDNIYGHPNGGHGGYTSIVREQPVQPKRGDNPFWRIILGIAVVIFLFYMGLRIHNQNHQEPPIIYPPHDSIVSDSVEIDSTSVESLLEDTAITEVPMGTSTRQKPLPKLQLLKDSDVFLNNSKTIFSIELDNGTKREVVAFFNEDTSPYIGIRDNGKELKNYQEMEYWAFSYHYFEETKKLLLVCDPHSQGGDALLGALSILSIDLNDLKVETVASGPIVDITDDGFTVPDGRILNPCDAACEHIHLWHDVHYDKNCQQVYQSQKEYSTDELSKKYKGVMNKLNAGKAFLFTGNYLELSELGGSL